MINPKEEVSQATEEGKMLKLTLHCARVEVDKRHKVTSSGGSNLLSCQYSYTSSCSLMSILV